MNKQEYLAKRKVLLDEAEQFLNDGRIEEFNAKEKEINDLDEQFEAYAKAQTNMTALKEKTVNRMVIDDMSVNNKIGEKPKQLKDVFGTEEYRIAFMNYCKTGEIPKEFSNVDTHTSTSDAGAVIPTTIMNEIIKKMESYGEIFKRVRKTNIKGGVEVPILSLKPTATWIGESSTSDRQKVQANTKVAFTYYGLECKVATSLLTDITSLSIFEQTLTQLIVEAMIKALENAVINGDGNGKPMGLTNDTRIPSENIITLSSSDFVKWDAWKKKVFAKIPLAYRAGGVFIMAAGTFEGYVDGMVDANGQPIGRVNYGISDSIQERFGGKQVLLVEDDIIPPYDSASTGDVVAVFCKLSDYCINSNMQMKMYRWLDHDTNQWVDKALLVADGKVLDPNGVLIIKKGA